MIKNILKLFLFISFIFLSNNILCNEYVSIHKTIGEDEIEFIISNGYDDLLAYYEVLINMYCESENNNLSKDDIITRYEDIVSELTTKILELNVSLYSYEYKVDEYIKDVEKLKFYMGGLLDARLSLLSNITISIGPEFLTTNNKWYFGLGFPIHIMWKDNVDFGLGVQLRFGRRLQF